MPTSTHLNVLPLGSYSMLLGMDWLFIHRTKVDFYDKAIECLDDDGGKESLAEKEEAYISENGYNYAGKVQFPERIFVVCNAYFQ